MRRITISLPEDVSEALAHEARRRSVPVSAIAREALVTRLGLAGEPPRLGFVGLGRSGRGDTSRRVDEILAAEWSR